MLISSARISALLLPLAALAQHVFINNVQPAYDNLPACAEQPLSTIVRDMVSGCGDGNHETSFSCFCAASATHFAELISTEVVASCTQSAEALATAAVDVFHSYCELRPGNGSSKALVTAAPTLRHPAESTPTLPASQEVPVPIPSSGASYAGPSGLLVFALLSGLFV